MPGVIMENGSRKGSHTNHDRDHGPNGVNGGEYLAEKVMDKGKSRAEPQQSMTPTSPSLPNGLHGGLTAGLQKGAHQAGPATQTQVDQLPPEIAHITQGYMDLKLLISRLAQKTHSDLTGTIRDLAQMPLPASMVNGNSAHTSATDDSSVEGLNKKLRLLKFASDSHEAWTKALVITGWSRNAEDVSKIIDLKIHLDEQERHYNNCVDTMALDRQSLKHARLPNPDLRTALEILGTGRASWMPDLGYIQPPSLTAQEVLKTFEKLNTLLSIRLNLTDYERVPFHFKDFIIKDGRVTFRVNGEFEVDLTITEEDPEAQFWFIDIRFHFWPSLDILTPQLRFFIDKKMNDVLREDGLPGCYKVLHEMVLTYKINEFRRQATTLSTSKWTPTLRVEPLHRAISIQYWADRFDRISRSSGKPPRSWLILGVHSGKRKEGRPHPSDTSRLFIRWFRESKEIKDVDISFDDVQISTESLLRLVISKHIAYILTSIYERLRAMPLYANRHLELSLFVSDHGGADSELKVQLTAEHHLSIRIEPISGRFVFGPPSRRVLEYESGINASLTDPANHAHESIERLRYSLIIDGMAANSRTVGWAWVKNPGVKAEQLQSSFPKDSAQVQWYRRYGWAEDWYLCLVLGVSGEQWMLVQTAITSVPTNPNLMILAKKIAIPIRAVSPVTTYRFLTSLSFFAAAMISYHENLKILWNRKDAYMLVPQKHMTGLTLPAVHIRLSDLLPSKNRLPRTGKPWAKDVVKLTFQGVEIEKKRDVAIASSESTSPIHAPGTLSLAPVRHEDAIMITEARMVVPLPQGLNNMNQKVDRDIAFHPRTGSFAFRLRSRVGEPIIDDLRRRVISVERLVQFVQVLQHHGATLSCESVSLDRIVFIYGKKTLQVSSMNATSTKGLGYKATIDFSAAKQTMSLFLERGNPHLLILDHLTKVLNSPHGLDGIAVLLPITLPVLRALSTVQDSWAEALAERGSVFVNVRATELYNIRYILRQHEPPIAKRIQFEIKMRHRRGEPWWYVRRSEIEGRNREPDLLDGKLKEIWSDRGDGWVGMRVSGVAQPSGIEELLGKIDEAVRQFASSDRVFSAPPLPQSAPAIPQQPIYQPQSNTMAQQNKARPGMSHQAQRQQQPTPNHSQSQKSQNNSQGSMHSRNPLKRTHEVVEID